MMLAIPLHKYNRQFIVSMPSVKNTMVDKGIFIRLLYSTTNVTFNGIYIYIHQENHKDVCAVEKDVLQIHTTTKTPVFSIERQLLRTPKQVLKISGIWENETSYGLVYKFID